MEKEVENKLIETELKLRMEQKISTILTAQRNFFSSGETRDYQFRRKQLKTLQMALKKYEKPLCDALWNDLHKSTEEAILTELSIVTGEIRNHLSHLKSWMKRKKRPTPLKMFPSRSYLVTEPLGNALIVAPWNYPVQLLLNPLVGAISAGCTAVLKPSPYVPTVSKVLADLINEFFDEKYIALVQGNRDVNTLLFNQRFDIIFFTGSPELGKKVMQAASKHLTPVVLELGGKSPCIVDKDADVEMAARRIAWGKTLNSGQTCIAPDYLLIHQSQKEKFISAYKKALDLKPSSDIFKLNYAQAILASTPQRKELLSLIPLLEHANRNKNSPEAYHLLGQTYANLGEYAIADYFSAEYNHLIGNNTLAQKQLNKALKQQLKENIKLRAQDLQQKLKKQSPKKTLF